MNIREILKRCQRVMPVVAINDAAQAVPLAKALAEGGLGGFEKRAVCGRILDSRYRSD